MCDDKHYHLLDMTIDINKVSFQGLQPVMSPDMFLFVCLLQMMIIMGVIALLLIGILIGK